jgi:hypothetical protein
MSYKKTHAERQRQELEDAKSAYCKLFNITEQQYCENEFELGLLWLDRNNYDMDFQYSKTFWSWWKVTVANAIKSGLNNPEILEQIDLSDFAPLKSTLRQIKNETKRRADGANFEAIV